MLIKKLPIHGEYTKKGVGFLNELDPVASPNAVKLRSRICSHLRFGPSLDTRQFDSKICQFLGSTCTKQMFL